MSTSPRDAEKRQTFGPVLTRPAITGAMALFCLTAAPRAAHAHDDDAPTTPEKFWTGTALFVLLTLLVFSMAFRARLPIRRMRYWLRRRRRLRHRRR